MRQAFAGSVVLLLTLAIQACNHSPQAKVVAADGALCDITRRLAAGDLQVSCLLGPEDDPHQLQLTPQQTRQIRQAQLVLINGYGLTPALERLPNTLKVAELAAPNSPSVSGHDRDPHVWHDPQQAAAMVKLVGRQLEQLDPQAAPAIKARAAAMQGELGALDTWNRAQFKTIPAPRILASSHRGFASLARAYRLEELPVIDASSASETLRPQTLASVVNRLRSTGVRSLFSEQTPASPSLQRISSLSGVPLANRPLLADAAGDNLMVTLTANTCLIVDALAGQCDQGGAATLVKRWDAIR